MIVIPPESGFKLRRIQIFGKERLLEPKPKVKKIFVKLPKPTLSDVRPDYERLLDALLRVEKSEHIEIDYDVLKGLPDIIRRSNFEVTITVWDGRKIIALEPGDTSNEMFSLAVDIGTSKIVGYLVDLVTGKTLDLESLENPQLAYGEDIITRINYAIADSKNLKTLQTLVVEVINKIIRETCKRTRIDPNKIYEVVVVGNTAMHHLFLGIQPKYTALSPFTPAIKTQLNLKASEVNIDINPSGIVTVLLVIAGYVGADAVADVLATGVCDSSNISLLIDIGTNTEIFVGNSEDMLSCSCAAGPAFEGFHIKHGMKGKKLKGKDIAKIFIAGAFGNYINPENAKIIGLIPDVPAEKVEFVGNTAIIGAKMALISGEAREKADIISKKVRYLELAADPDFKKEFLNATLIRYC